MDIEVLVHGVPEGQGCYGIKEEQSHVDLFYDNSSESVKFVIETKELGNAYYTYYTYLRYKGILGYGGRPGSYFGLTLRIDKYYQDVIHMYNMLEMVFKKYVVGSLLKPSGESYEYMAPSFAAKKSELEQLQRGLIQMIQNSCVFSKFVDLDASFIHPITTAASCNIADITENAMLAALKKYSKVVLSPDYKLNLAKEYEKKIQEVEGKGGGIVAEKDKKLAEKDEVINSQQAKIETLQAEVKRKETENLQNKKNLQLSQMISGIKEPINNLAEYFHVHDSQRNPPMPSYGFKNFIIGIIGCVLSAIVIALLLFAKPQKGADTKTLDDKIAELSQTNSELEKAIALKDATISDLRKQLDNQPSTPPELPPVTKKNLRIDVSPYNKTGDPLYEDSEYVLKIKELMPDGKHDKCVFNGNGTYTLTNAVITKGKESDLTITIKPNGKGPVTLEYQSENCSCSPRTFQVEKKPAANNSISIVVSPEVTEVEVGQEYTFSVSGYEGNGKWSFSGFEPQKGKVTDNSLVVKVIDNGKKTATATYTPNKGEPVVSTYDFKADD
jgi:hypothetical protein